MKRYVILIGAVLVVFMAAWAAFGQRESGQPSSDRSPGREGFPMFQLLSPEEMAKIREKWPNMSQEEREKFRAQMREKWESLPDEEREKFRNQIRERFAYRRGGLMGSEEQLQAIKTIEEHLAKLKTSIKSMQPGDVMSYRDLSEEERTKLRERFTKAQQDRRNALRAIIKQVDRLQGQRRPAAEVGEYLIINTNELKSIRDSAMKEKSKETAQLLERLIARAAGQRRFGGRQPESGPRPQSGTRPPRPRRDVSEPQGGPESSGG